MSTATVIERPVLHSPRIVVSHSKIKEMLPFLEFSLEYSKKRDCIYATLRIPRLYVFQRLHLMLRQYCLNQGYTVHETTVDNNSWARLEFTACADTYRRLLQVCRPRVMQFPGGMELAETLNNQTLAFLEAVTAEEIGAIVMPDASSVDPEVIAKLNAKPAPKLIESSKPKFDPKAVKRLRREIIRQAELRLVRTHAS